MENAIAAFLAATTAADARAAYESMVAVFAADDDLPEGADLESGVDAMLNQRGLPSLSDRLQAIEMADTDATVEIAADATALEADAEYDAWVAAGGNG